MDGKQRTDDGAGCAPNNITPGFIYAAMDPKQPGAAFAIAINDGSPDLFRDLAGWARQGAIPQLLPHEQAMAAFHKWERPVRKTRKKAAINAASEPSK